MRLMGMNHDPGNDAQSQDQTGDHIADLDPAGSLTNPTIDAAPAHEPPADPQPPVTHFGSDAGFDDLSEESAQKSHTGLVILATIAALSGATLWGMHHLGTRGNIDLVDISIDYPLETGGIQSDYSELLEDLRASTQLVQVAPEMIQMNPFSWKSTAEPAIAGIKTPDQLAAERAERERQQLLVALDSTVASFRVGSIMGGRVPMAQVSGELVREGDTLAEHFTVVAIQGRAITLSAEGRSWTIGVD